MAKTLDQYPELMTVDEAREYLRRARFRASAACLPCRRRAV